MLEQIQHIISAMRPRRVFLSDAYLKLQKCTWTIANYFFKKYLKFEILKNQKFSKIEVFRSSANTPTGTTTSAITSYKYVITTPRMFAANIYVVEYPLLEARRCENLQKSSGMVKASISTQQ